MSARARPMILICTNCAEVATLPKDRDHRRLWDKGWRWIGTHDLFSCPGCLPVVLVSEDGKHRSPKRLRAVNAEGPDTEGTASPSGPQAGNEA
jgi:hypothetical protein